MPFRPPRLFPRDPSASVLRNAAAPRPLSAWNALWLAVALAVIRSALAASPVVAEDAGAALACDTLVVYVREGCPHCRDAKAYLGELRGRLPQLRVEFRDVRRDPAARAELEALSRSRHIGQPGVPTFTFCDELLVGFDGAQSTGALIEDVLTGRRASIREGMVADIPVVGEISPAMLGLPVFTVIVGLVDGFNPCAMWVLLFLLSLLVHVRSRARILMVAGTFVLMSGAVYYAFMAAWLNVFMIIGYSRSLQLGLGVLALVVGTIHIKDFFFLHRGISLSIPESAKPTLYERARRVVRAENLFAAICGVTVIAILVNFVELLCTAGLPALYTQVLSYYPLDTFSYYGYLFLYILAYVADDSVMVAIAVATLGQRRLQEREGRWLKLLSGAVICVLGALLVLAPDWLVF